MKKRYQPAVAPLSGYPLTSEAIAEECANTKCKSGENIDRTSLQKQLGLPIPVSFERVFIRKEDIPLSANLLSKYVPEENLVSFEEDSLEIEEETPELLSPAEEAQLEENAKQLMEEMAGRREEFSVWNPDEVHSACAIVDAKEMVIIFVPSSFATTNEESSEDPTIILFEKRFDKKLEHRDTMYDSDNRPVRDNLKTLSVQKRSRMFRGVIREFIGKC